MEDPPSDSGTSEFSMELLITGQCELLTKGPVEFLIKGQCKFLIKGPVERLIGTSTGLVRLLNMGPVMR